MRSAYARGRAFEYRVRDHLQRGGWWVVRQARSAFPDLVALRPGRVLLVECRVDGRMSKTEREEARRLEELTGGEFLLACREGRRLRFRKPEEGANGRGAESQVVGESRGKDYGGTTPRPATPGRR